MTSTSEQTAEANFLCGHLVARGLSDLGITTVFFSPGSRSTPLIIGCEKEKRLSCFPALDERTAAFLALGHAKRTNVTTAVICTSGSALTHWFPTVTEASYSGIPLLLLSADRPPELQECGAGQTINQINLFGSFVREFYQSPLPCMEQEQIHNLQTILQTAHSKTVGPNSGPVHINFSFREPLWPSADSTPKLPHFSSLVRTAHSDQTEHSESTDDLTDISQASGPVVIAGLNTPSSLPEKFQSIPILCDSLCALRETKHPARILRFENLLRCPKFRESIKPDQFILLGPLPTSKTLRSWIEESGAPRLVIEPSGRIVDPLLGTSHSIRLNFEQLDRLDLPKSEPGWLEKWTAAEQQVEEKIDLELKKITCDHEPKIARILSEHLPANSNFYCANSMPIRDLEWFWKPSKQRRNLFGARGVNGIDGTLGTAIGIAHQSNQPTFLLTGELAFLHDSNALLFASELIGSLTIFLINNQGGGIFENLAVANLPEFEKCFATPQSCDFAKLCAAHSVEYLLHQDEKELISHIKSPPKEGIRVIEIRTDRKADRKVRQNLLSLGT
jgi:2-succinyl-5-enolpyruvyl-6-hydroxy-3-cyclohexene-1-carboxylate synthase